MSGDGTRLVIPPGSRYAIAVTMPESGDLVLEMPPLEGAKPVVNNGVLYTNDGTDNPPATLGTVTVDPSVISYADGFFTFPTQKLMQVTEEAMWRGIAAATPGGHVGDISHAIGSYVRGAGDFGIVEEYTGHGIGSAMHQPHNVPNLGKPGKGVRLVEGLALAVEPMIVAGDPWTHTDDDEWTVRTEDGSLAAHFEHTFTITSRGTWVLTALDGGEARLAELGVPFGGR